MIDVAPLLKNIGLEEKESLVYVTLLKSGSLSMMELTKQTELKRPTVYLYIEKLKKEGLVSEIAVGKRKKYSATHPKRIVEMAKLRSRSIENIFPQLLAFYNSPQSKPKIQIFEGKKGIQLVYRELYNSLSTKEEALWFTRMDALEKYMPFAVNEYKKILKQLKEPKIRELIFANPEGEKWLQEMQPILRNNTKHQIRLLKTEYEFGLTDNLIFGNKMVIFSLSEGNFVLMIESHEIIKTFRVLFETSWEKAKANVFPII